MSMPTFRIVANQKVLGLQPTGQLFDSMSGGPRSFKGRSQAVVELSYDKQAIPFA